MKIDSIQTNYLNTMDVIKSACISNNRNENDVKLIVVTKGKSSAKIGQVISAGARFLGENYPEETIEKKQHILNPPEDLEWHMIGHLQSRKSNQLINNFQLLHSLDSLKLAKRLDNQFREAGKILKVLLQFNVGGEESKYGWNASDKSNWSTFIDNVNEIKSLKNLQICGLMTMPPYTLQEEIARKNFSKLKELGSYLENNIDELDLQEYSMGTSHDYKYAIAEGATMVRIGTAIMGSRD